MKKFLMLAVLVAVASCGGGGKAPRNLDNACLLAREKPAYFKAMRDTNSWGAKRTRITDATDFMGWYMDGSADRLGISKWNAREQYLAYHEGRSGYAKGSYNDKGWLLAVADKVAARAEMYRSQLSRCGR